jgi:lipid A ethanolaminephosphotransferase
MFLQKIALQRPVLIILTAIYCLIFLNVSFWQKSYAVFFEFPLVYVCYIITICCLFTSVLLLFSSPYITKAFLIVLTVAAAAASYFIDNLGTMITPEIVIDALTTTNNEGRALLTTSLVIHMFIFGIVPSIIIAFVTIIPRPYFKLVWLNLKFAFGLLGITLVAMALQSASIVSSIREHREMIEYFNPVSPLISVIKGVQRTYFNPPVVLAKLGVDAKKSPWLSAQTKPNVTVLVIGETARSMNFSLFGYGRPTNPELSKRDDLILFPGTTSCGTLTADSVPCMFSNLTRAGFSRGNAATSENLLNVLGHAGIKAQWFEANTGSKGVAAQLGETMLGTGNNPRFCRQNECDDEVLVEKLSQLLAGVTENSVIVLHQIGSHGPAYFMRYPESFKPFGPDCRSSDFKKCSREEIINAYDNTIALTDKTLAATIDLLARADDKISSTLIYMSDHGESLGELRLYLHGMPYVIAPPEQTHVPFIAWASKSYLAARNTSLACMRSRTDGPSSHDNFFHTVLGITGVSTQLYQPELDVFSQCWGDVTN